MVSTENCPICNCGSLHISPIENVDPRFKNYFCGRCGAFDIHTTTVKYWIIQIRNSDNGDRLRANASGWISENQGVTIEKDIIDKILVNLKTPFIFDRLDKILLEFSKESKSIADSIEFDEHRLIGISWSIDTRETAILLHKMEALQWIEKRRDGGHRINLAGWERLNKILGNVPDSSQGFIAMWFDSDMDEAESAIREAIKSAGYIPHRVDDDEHTGKVDDKIITEIRKSRFIVADFTDQRGGVYFEAGFAQGLGLHVFWTCKKNDLKNLHFDTRQYNFIDWENPEDLEKRLSYRIEAVLGKGNYQDGT